MDADRYLAGIELAHAGLRRAYRAVVGIAVALNREDVATAAKRCMDLLSDMEQENKKIIEAIRSR